MTHRGVFVQAGLRASELRSLPPPEFPRWQGKELEDWLRAQGAYTEKVLAGIGGREALHALGLGTSNAFGFKRAGGLIFYKAVGAGQQLPRLMVRGASGDGACRSGRGS